jgi:hypothetical protein
VHTKHEFLPPESFLRFSQRTCPIHYFSSKTHVWVVFAQFRCRTSPIPKTGIGCIQTQFLPPEPFLRFSQRTCPINYFRSKAHVSGAFAHSENGYRGAYKARVFATVKFLRFLQRTCPIHYFRSKTHVSGAFAQFRCRTSPIPKTGIGFPKTGIGVHMKHEFLPPEPFLRFLQRTCLIH